MLSIKNLSVEREGKNIINGLNLEVQENQVVGIMGPNGSGKSTLCHTLIGDKRYQITEGTITFKGLDIMSASSVERANMGLFLSFQNPVSIEGLSAVQFLKHSVDSKKKYLKQGDYTTKDFMSDLRQNMEILGIPEQEIKRPFNVDFSGGEKKKYEVLQILMLKPCFVILDEIDSGLDVDSLKLISRCIKEHCKTVLIITHYNRIFDHIVPDVVNILIDGNIQSTGDCSLAKKIEIFGYDHLKK